jgi:integrase
MAGRWERTKTPGIYVQAGANGKPRYKAVFRDSRGMVTGKTFPNVKLAQAFLHDVHVKKATGSLPDTSKARQTVDDLWAYFERTSRAKPSTMAWYESRWRVHVAPALGSRRVGDIRPSELAEFYADLERRTSLSTRRGVQQLVHKLFAVAASPEAEWIVRNPADGIRMPAAQPREARFLTEEEVAHIADEVPPTYHALVWTLAVAGLRIGEACALRRKNLNGSIRVVENSVEVRGVKTLGTPKTQGSERVVPIPPFLRRMLTEHLQTFGNIFDPQSFVFTTQNGSQVSQNNFRKKVFQPAAMRAGVLDSDGKPPTVHDLRHAAAAIALKHGLTPYEVAKMLGHTDTKMVERIYGHLYESAFQAKVDALDAVYHG